MLEVLFFTVLILPYTPFGLYQMFLMLQNMMVTGRRYQDEEDLPVLERPNRVLVVTITNGMATDVVEKIIATIDGYKLDVKQYVIKEERDPFRYSCEEIVVPKGYQSAHRSRNKMRALQYGIEWLHEKGYGRETYICHLDDDSIVTKDYLEYLIEHMESEGGQGCIRLREFGHHLLSSLADIVRVANCEAWCSYYNHKNRPVFVHGEGIAVRADVEYEIGWDFATYGAEDLMMGLEIANRYRFTDIPCGNILIAPPTSATDFFKQRRRWFWSIFKNDGKVRKLSGRTFALYLYMYFVGLTGSIGVLIWPITLIFVPHLPLTLAPFWILNAICFFSYYQFGAAYHGSVKTSVTLFALQLLVAFYDALTVIYALVSRPDFTTFETIKKV